MQKISFIGNLTADPTMFTTKSGKTGCYFTVAVSRHKREFADYFRISVFDAISSSCMQYLHKGSKVYVDGELQAEAFTKKDGNPGVNLNVFAYTVEFLPSSSQKRENEIPKEGMPKEYYEDLKTVEKESNPFDDLTPSDIPF